MKPRIILPVLYLAILIAFYASSQIHSPRTAKAQSSNPSSDGLKWRDPESCRACHQEAYEAWATSYHALANAQVESLREHPMFRPQAFKDAWGDTYEIRKTQDGDIEIANLSASDSQAAQTIWGSIGHHPLIQPIVLAEKGRLQVHAIAWDVDKEEWFNTQAEEKAQPGDWGHWNGQGMNWNSNCAQCHMTNYQKRYDLANDSYSSQWHAHGLSCVSCHEGLETHYNQVTAERLSEATGRYSVTVNMDTCANCHSRREELTKGAFQPGEAYADHFHLIMMDQPGAHFPDGKARGENFVYGSLVHSRMGHAGVSCIDCHEPHSNALRLPTQNNALCIQCHGSPDSGATLIDPTAHSGHPTGSSGNNCVACHMPERIYMGRDPRRDHGFTIPDPYMTQEFGAPNACADCHAGKGEDWMLESFQTLFGESERVTELRARAHLLRAAWNGQLAEPDRLAVAFAQEENPYWRASYLRLMRPFAQWPSVAQIAKSALAEELPELRAAAAYTLAGNRGAIEALRSALDDPSRAARLAAAQELAFVAPLDARNQKELAEMWTANADRPVSSLKLAALSQMRNKPGEVRGHVDRAISFDPKNAALHRDAAILLQRSGHSTEALRRLEQASRLDPADGNIWHSLGLLEAELGELSPAVASLKQATELEPAQARWHYNLAILQLRSGKPEAARASARAALKIDPGNTDYLRLLELVPPGP